MNKMTMKSESSVLASKMLDNREHLRSVLELPEINVQCLLVYKGGSEIEYYFIYKNNLLFVGNDYRPSRFHSIDGLHSMIDLMAFLTVQKGDTDESYFKDYNQAQIEFSESSDCETLRLYVYDFEEKEPETTAMLKVRFKHY